MDIIDRFLYCADCKHKDPKGRKCKAFPEGIPEEIVTGNFDHTKPYPGDNDIRFEPKK
jgi:hypothetical protein